MVGCGSGVFVGNGVLVGNGVSVGAMVDVGIMISGGVLDGMVTGGTNCSGVDASGGSVGNGVVVGRKVDVVVGSLPIGVLVVRMLCVDREDADESGADPHSQKPSK